MVDSVLISKTECLNALSNVLIAVKEEISLADFEWGGNFGFEEDVNQFVRLNLERAFSLIDDISFLLRDERLLGAVAASRASFETLAVVVEFFRKFKAAIERLDYDGLKKVIGSYIFASLEFSEVSLVKTPNILSAVRNAETGYKGSFRVYEVLCEAVHPNWSGRISRTGDGALNWEDPTTQRLIVAITAASSFALVFSESFADFRLFLQQNRKRIRNTVMY